MGSQNSSRSASRNSFVFTSESVSEGHPDKVCDFIADSILDAHLTLDSESRVACEVLVKDRNVVLAGEITSRATVDFETVVREAIDAIGYVDPLEPFNAAGAQVTTLLSRQAPEISQGVDTGGAGDQGLMFGFASNETPSLMPLPITLAHALAFRLARDRHNQVVPWLRPDAKTQVSVRYEDNTPVAVETVLVSTQHHADVEHSTIVAYVRDALIPAVLGEWYDPNIQVLVNPTGSFVLGGPSAD
ncbi:MAG: S-adenosylmethionine synthetase N-terminal domain-containing protein, partial [Gemmatimonadaceae bacterium]